MTADDEAEADTAEPTGGSSTEGPADGDGIDEWIATRTELEGPVAVVDEGCIPSLVLRTSAGELVTTTLPGAAPPTDCTCASAG